MTIQSVLFKTKEWTPVKSRKWLKDKQIVPCKPVHKTNRYLRYRIRDPKEFTKLRTKTVNKTIRFIVGFNE